MLVEAIWSETLVEALGFSDTPGTFRELRDSLEAIPRRGDAYRTLLLAMHEHATLDPECRLEAFLAERNGESGHSQDPR